MPPAGKAASNKVASVVSPSSNAGVNIAPPSQIDPKVIDTGWSLMRKRLLKKNTTGSTSSRTAVPNPGGNGKRIGRPLPLRAAIGIVRIIGGAQVGAPARTHDTAGAAPATIGGRIDDMSIADTAAAARVVVGVASDGTSIAGEMRMGDKGGVIMAVVIGTDTEMNDDCGQGGSN